MSGDLIAGPFPGGDKARRDALIEEFRAMRKSAPLELQGPVGAFTELFVDSLQRRDACDVTDLIEICEEVDAALALTGSETQALVTDTLVSLLSHAPVQPFDGPMLAAIGRTAWFLDWLLRLLLKRNLSLSFECWRRILEFCAIEWMGDDSNLRLNSINKAAWKLMELSGDSEPARNAIRHVISVLETDGVRHWESRQIIRGLFDLERSGTKWPVKAGEAWSDAVRRFLESASEAVQQKWARLIVHCQVGDRKSVV